MKNIFKNLGLLIGLVSILSPLLVSAAPASACVPPPSGLVAWFPVDGTSKDLITGSSATSQDVSYVPGKVGQALYLNAISYVAPGMSEPISGITNQFTLDAWVNIPSNPYDLGYQRFITLQGNDWSVGPEAAIRLDGNDQAVLFVWTTDGLKYITDPNPFPNDRFVHVSGVFNGAAGHMELYIDGSLVGSVAMPVGTSMGSKLDRTAGSPTQALVGILEAMWGSIDEPMVFNRALTQAEIQTMINADSAGVCKPTANNGHHEKDNDKRADKDKNKCDKDSDDKKEESRR